MDADINPYSAPEADLLSPIEPRAIMIASKGSRFATFILDYIGYIILSMFIGFTIGIVFRDEGIEAMEQVPSLLIGLTIIAVYYVFFEGIWGRTPGKFVMGTIVVTEQGERPSFGQIIIRTLCRFIPFEPFSCLGERGWHDSIPKVHVVYTRAR